MFKPSIDSMRYRGQKGLYVLDEDTQDDGDVYKTFHYLFSEGPDGFKEIGVIDYSPYCSMDLRTLERVVRIYEHYNMLPCRQWIGSRGPLTDQQIEMLDKELPGDPIRIHK